MNNIFKKLKKVFEKEKRTRSYKRLSIKFNLTQTSI